MKNLQNALLTAFVVLIVTSISMAQDLIQYPAPSLELKIMQSAGRNGASVTYNPLNKLYYAAMAGNKEYPLETFASNGDNLLQSQAFNDLRGMWWNPKAKALEGNCYLNGGIVTIGLNDMGYAGTGNKVIFEGADHQPFDQAVGTFDPKKKEILYYQDGTVVGYSRKDGSPTGTNVVLSLPVDKSDLNYTTLIFTGVKEKELGLLDYKSSKVYLFNRINGNLTGTVNLPSSATLYELLNFSYANGYVFLFEKDARKWVGYKIFEF